MKIYMRYALMGLALILSACGLNDQSVQQYQATKEQKAEIDKKIKDSQNWLNQISVQTKHGKEAYYQNVALEEDWQNNVNLALDAGNQASTVLKKLDDLAQKDTYKDQERFDRLLVEARNLFVSVRTWMAINEERLEEIDNAVINRRDLNDRVQSLHALELRKTNKILPVIDQYSEKYRDRSDVLAELRQGFAWNIEEMTNISDSSSKQASLHNEADVSIDDIAKITLYLKNYQPVEVDNSIKYVSSLSKTELKTLIDIKEVCKIEFGRSTWDSSSDWDNTLDEILPRKFDIPCVQAEAMEGNMARDTEFARVGKNWGKPYFKLKNGSINQEWINNYTPDLQSLSLNSWPQSGSRDEGSLWINDISYEYYHKYRIVSNDSMTKDQTEYKTDWIPVSEEYYFDRIEDLGMDVASKADGKFSDEESLTSTPHGMAFVDNHHYGSWQNNTWVMNDVMQYMIMRDLMDVSRYNRASYGRYSNWSSAHPGEPWYDYNKTSKKSTYGSTSAHTQKRMAGSHFSRSGGFKHPEFSVRSSGPAARGGGPGGGGK